MQTILGAGGIIGTELAKALPAYTSDIRLVSRTPKKVNETDELVSCDLLIADQVSEAVQGSEVAYLTVGLPYQTKIWQEQWPIIMKNVVEACKKHQSRLVFFDNVYMYDPRHIPFMTEETPINPSSKKGKVRESISQFLMSEVALGNLEALIVRSADFYGPDNHHTSVLGETVFKNLYEGKKANWLGSVNYRHDFTYTPDAGKATALLGNDTGAYNQVWHLPTAKEPLTGKEWIRAIAEALDVKPQYQVAGKPIVTVMGWFNPIMREMKEMLYQYTQDYVFSSQKFEEAYAFRPTPYYQGIRETISRNFSP